MPTVTLAFRRRQKNILGRLLNFFSGMKGFQHVELVFPDGRAFSSTSLEKGRQDGCRFTTIHDLHDPKQWACVALECTDGELAVMMERAAYLAHVGARYDFAGIKAFINPFREHDPEKWFCSEVVEHLLDLAGIGKMREAAEDCTPNGMAKVYGATKLIA